MTKQTSALVVAFISLGTASFANAQDRLLASSDAERIGVTIRRDGNAMFVALKNGSPSVLTSAKVVCSTYDTENPGAQVSWSGVRLCDPVTFGFSYLPGATCQQRGIWSVPISEKLLPGKTKEHYFEPPSEAMSTLRCSVQDMRGREKKVWDF